MSLISSESYRFGDELNVDIKFKEKAKLAPFCFCTAAELIKISYKALVRSSEFNAHLSSALFPWKRPSITFFPACLQA